METTFTTLGRLRHRTITLIEGLSIDQLNKIPQGFNNNITWNTAHLVAAMQRLCYKRSDVPLRVSETFFQRYKPESKPEHEVDERALNEIKELLISSINQLKEDYHAGIFKTYTPFTTRYGVDVANVDDAIRFLPFHEGLHMGYIQAMKKLV
ncbi:MAG: DinB family protein [Sphingobacteriales bacterium]|nr:MAG: DinB family protein [Sphingobacteriales bacterium]